MSITIFASCEDKKQWDEYVLDNSGHPFQLWVGRSKGDDWLDG